MNGIKLMRRSSIVGLYLLETSLLLLLGLPLTLGIIDITSAHRAETALQTAIETGLRCIYPINGECRGNSLKEQLFDWYNYTLENGYLVSDTEYSLSSDQNQPRILSTIYEWDSYKVEVLESISTTITTQKYAAETYQSRFTQGISYLEQIKDLPKIQGNSARSAYSMEAPKSRLTSSNSLSRERNTLTFDLPVSDLYRASGLNNETKCLMNINGVLTPSEVIQRNVPCDQQASEGALKIGLLIRAEVLNGKNGNTNDVELSLKIIREKRGATTETTVPLGGQIFNAPGSGKRIATNFHPRGFNSQYLSAPIVEELKYHGSLPAWATTAITIPGDTKKAQLILRHGRISNWDGSLQFRPTAIEIYTPSFRPALTEATCSISSNSTANRCDLMVAGITINSSQENSPKERGFNPIGPLIRDELLEETYPLGTFDNASEANLAFESLIRKKSLRKDATRMVAVQNSWSTRRENFRCPIEKETGALSPSSESCFAAARVRFGQDVELDPRYITASAPQNEKERESYEWRSSWTPTHCDERLNFRPPSGLSRYERYSTPEISSAKKEKRRISGDSEQFLISVASGSASQLKEQYRCEYFGLEYPDSRSESLSINIDNSLTRHFSERRIVVPTYNNDPVCKLLQDRNLTEYFGITQESLNQVSQRITESRKVSSPPLDSCISFSLSPSQVKRTLVATGVNNSFTPEVCKSSKSCQRFPRTLGQSSSDDSFDLIKAESIMKDALISQFPSLNETCSPTRDSDCHSFKINISNERVTITGATTPRSFLPRSYPIKISLSRDLERL